MARYIDTHMACKSITDEMTRLLEEQKKATGNLSQINNIRHTIFGLGKAMDILGDVPTADVRENVKGHVITRLDTREYGKSINMYFCSVCGKQLFLPQNYCPNCGADMRGDDNE